MRSSQKHNTRRLKFLCCLLSGAGLQASGQVTPPATSTVSDAPQRTSYGQSVLFSPADSVLDIAEGIPLQWGPVGLRPHLLYRFSYGDGIQSAPGQSEKTFIHEISPGILLHLGNVWTLDYTPTWTFYSSDDFRDTLGHFVNLNGNTTYNDWNFGLSQTYRKSSDPIVQTGSQTDQETYATGLSASYQFSEKMWTDLGLNQNLRFTENFNDSREWSTLDWLNYRFAPGYYAGIGIGFGYEDVEIGSDMTYQQAKAQLGWLATEKISFNFNAGGETRQFLGSDANTIINPVFGVTLGYQPFDVTRLSLSADRSVSASYFQDEITETTSLRVNLNQRLLEVLNLDLTYSYYVSDFVSSETGSDLDREDDGSSVSVRLGCRIRKRVSLAVFYHWSKNSSTHSAFEYSTSQVGLEAGYRF